MFLKLILINNISLLNKLIDDLIENKCVFNLIYDLALNIYEISLNFMFIVMILFLLTVNTN